METSLKMIIEVKNLLLLLTKSDSATVVEFLRLESLNQSYIYNGIIIAIDKAIIANNEDDFKELSRILALFSDIFPDLTSLFDHDDNPFKMSNVVIMASKHNRVGILNHIYSDASSIINDFSIKVGRKFPLPTDKDEDDHDAFYYAIRSGNTQLLELLMKKWPSDYFASHTEDLCTLLSKNLNELLLKNVDVPIEMKMFINSFVLDYYFEENPPSDSSDYSHDDIQESLSLILEYGELFKTDYKKTESRDLMIYLARQIALNIMILKKRLKSTYVRIPWEEMEFHLISFIRYLTNQAMYVHCCITETDIAMYLDIFCKCLVEETKEIKSMDLNVLCELPEKIKRDDIVSTITLKYPEFKEFYQNYELIRDHESLVIIKKYVDIVTDVNALEKSGKTVVVRALQVIGENFKNSLESPKLSSLTNEYLLSFLPEKTNTILKTVRNSFSHGFPLSTCQEIGEMYGSEFYTHVQNDIKKLIVGITSVFQKIKFKSFRALLKKICDCEDAEILQDTFRMIKAICIKSDLSQLIPKNNDAMEVEKLVFSLRKIIKNKTYFEESIFSKIAEVISFEKKYLENSEMELQKHLRRLSLWFASDCPMNSNQISGLRWTISEGLLGTKNFLLTSQGLKKISILMNQILNDVICKIDPDVYQEFLSLLFKICYITEYQEHNVKYLQKLKKSPEKVVRINQEKIKSKKSACYQDIIADDITALRKIITKHHFSETDIESFIIYKNNAKLQAEIEMLLLSILSSLEHSNLHLITSQHSDENGNPLLIGRYLRNYLAHGNSLADALVDSTQFLFLFALKIIKYDIYREGKFTVKRTKNRSDSRTIVEKQERLFCALSSDSLDDVMYWIKQGADIHGRDRNLMTALHAASKSSNTDIITFLINSGLNQKAKDIRGRNLLHTSAASGYKQTVDYIIGELDISVHEVCEKRQTALHIASENGCFDVVKTLLHHKSRTNILDIYYETPILKAAINNRLDIVKLFLQDLKNINSIRDENGYTLLHIAAEGGFSDMVIYLLNRGADVNSVTNTLVTPLHLSSNAGHLETVKTLVSRGANVNAKTAQDGTPLHTAIGLGQLPVVEYLLNHGANINALNSDKRLPLHYAIKMKHMNIFKTLINYGASLDDIAICGDFIYKYAIYSQNLEVINYLIDNKVSINQRFEDGSTPLLLSIKKGLNHISKLLIQRGADINAADEEGATPLLISISRGNYDVARTLLSRKEAFSVKSVDGATLLHHCAIATKYTAIFMKEKLLIKLENYDEMASNSDMFNIFQTLVEMATEVLGDKVMEWVQQRNAESNTALHLACVSGNLDIVQYLCNEMSNIEIPGIGGYTPLHFAVDLNHLEVAKVLISSGKCSLNSMTSEGKTPLCLAAKKNYTDIAQLLIKNGADVNAGDPLETAADEGHQDMCLVLIRRKEIYSGKLYEGKIDNILQIASFRGLTQVVSYILQHKPLSEELSAEISMCLAIERGYEDILTLFLDYGVDVNFVFESNRYSPLSLATDRGHSRMIEILLDKGAFMNKLDPRDRRPIEVAISNGHLESVKVFFQYNTVDSNERINGDFTLLHLAAQWGHLEIVKFLINKNASINVTSLDDSKPIHIGARHGQLHVVQYFVQCNEELLYERGRANMTLLHYAAEGGQLEVIKYLIEKGLNVNLPDGNGYEPIFLAAMFNFEDAIEILLNNGAIYESVNSIRNETQWLLTKESIKKSLLSIGELFDSVKRNNLSNVKSLIEKGVCIHAKDSTHTTVLHYAVREGYVEITRILLNNNANPNGVGEKNATPLHYAAAYSRVKAAIELLENGAVYNAMTTAGKTPLDLATSNDIINLLQFVDNAFKSGQNCNINILNSVTDFEISDILKLKYARNEKGESLMNCVTRNESPKLNYLKSIFSIDSRISNHSNYDLIVHVGYKVTINKEKNLQEINQQCLVVENQNGKILAKCLDVIKGFQETLDNIQDFFQARQKQGQFMTEKKKNFPIG